MKQSILKSAAVLLSSALFSLSAEAVELPGPLVTADWLMENRDEVHVLDVRKDVQSYTSEGHIEGAVLVNVKKIRIARNINGKELTRMMPDASTYRDMMQSHGVSNDSVVVITHRGVKPGNVAGAARLYWQMKYYGFEQVALLDGGNQSWIDALGDMDKQAVVAKAGVLQPGEANNAILATLDDVEAALHDDNTVLLDTRSLSQHIGMLKRDYVYEYGHIPGSHLLPYSFLHPTRGAAVFLPNEVAVETMDSLRIDDNKQIIVYCNSAYEASSVWFQLSEVQGRDNVRIYDGSLHEWTQYEGKPMTRKITSFSEPVRLTMK